MYTWPTGRSQCPHISWVSDARVTDEQQPNPASSNPPEPENENPSGNEPPTPAGPSRRKVLMWGGIGVAGVAALGGGAFAVYASQSKNDKTQGGDPGQKPQGGPGGEMPSGGRSGRPSGFPSGARPSGFPSGGARRSRNASGMPTDQPTDAPS